MHTSRLVGNRDVGVMARLIGLVLAIAMVGVLGAVVSPVKAFADPVGNAYAVLDSEGTLTFFRSTSTYTDGTNQTVTDVAGNSYTGRVYTNVENQEGMLSGSAPWSDQVLSIQKVTIAPNQVISPVNCSNWFDGCENLADVSGLSALDTSNVTYMGEMFWGCSNAGFTAPDVSNWDTSNVTNMSSMFCGCSGAAFTAPDVSKWDISDVRDMTGMFSNCNGAAFTSIDLSGWNISKVTDTRYMFNNCSNLETIYAASDADWNASTTLTAHSSMFNGCSKLVGGNGTVFDSDKLDKAYARVDGLNNQPGYFTNVALKPNESSVGVQTGSGQMSLNFIAQNTREHGGTAVDSANPDDNNDGLGDNLAFTVPSAVNYVIKADGQLVGPSEGVAYIENKSAFATHVSAMDIDPETGFNFVADASASNTANSVDLQMGPATDMLQASNYLTKADVTDVTKWNMVASGSTDASKVLLKTTGDVSHLDRDVTSLTKFGTVKWYVMPGVAA